MSLYKKLKYFLLPAAFWFIVFGCGLEDLADYSTPGSTYQSYIRHAQTLRIVADHRSYRRVIRCFTPEDQRWFENNFKRLKKLPHVEIEEDIYRHLYLTKRKAYIFGRAVVPAGPDPEAEFEIEKISEEQALLRVENFEQDIRMVKGPRGWSMKGMFGLAGQMQE